MSNPFMPKSMPGPMGNMQNMMAQFEQGLQQFKQGFPANIDPKSEVEKALTSGRISQHRLNDAIQQARMMGFNI